MNLKKVNIEKEIKKLDSWWFFLFFQRGHTSPFRSIYPGGDEYTYKLGQAIREGKTFKQAILSLLPVWLRVFVVITLIVICVSVLVAVLLLLFSR